MCLIFWRIMTLHWRNIICVMTNGNRHLELGDFVGLDICLAIMDVLYKETGDSKYRACPLIRKMVRGGNLGCKTGKGFYVYNADRTKTPVDAL